MDGYDEALLLDVDGFVAEGSGENLFIVKNGKLYEPELTSALVRHARLGCSRSRAGSKWRRAA